MKWIKIFDNYGYPIIENLPKSSLEILIFTHDMQIFRACRDDVSHDILFELRPHGTHDLSLLNGEVTHWMPLPPAPGKESCESPCQLCKARHKSNHEVKK